MLPLFDISSLPIGMFVIEEFFASVSVKHSLVLTTRKPAGVLWAG